MEPMPKNSRKLRGGMRVAIGNLSVGDLIYYNALYQSRTGMIVRSEGSGRIESIAYRRGQHGRVQGELTDEDGRRHPFELSEDDLVYVIPVESYDERDVPFLDEEHETSQSVS
jgi:hypothetical protein